MNPTYFPQGETARIVGIGKTSCHRRDTFLIGKECTFLSGFHAIPKTHEKGWSKEFPDSAHYGAGPVMIGDTPYFIFGLVLEYECDQFWIDEEGA